MSIFEFAQCVALAMVVVPSSFLFGVLVDKCRDVIRLECGKDD